MTKEKLNKIAKLYAQDELKDNHAQVEDIVAAAFLNGIDYAENHPRWISVKNRKPEIKHSEDNMKYSDTVIVTNGKYCTSASWVYNIWGGWYGWYDDGDDELKDITHWMPLPQPPKKGGTSLPYEKEEIKVNQVEISPNRIIGTPEHIQVALDVIDKKGGEQ